MTLAYHKLIEVERMELLISVLWHVFQKGQLAGMDDFFQCAYCFEENSIFVDPSGGLVQRYVEDCQVCCRPNVLTLTWDDAIEGYLIQSEPES